MFNSNCFQNNYINIGKVINVKRMTKKDLPEGKISHNILKKLTSKTGAKHRAIIQKAFPGFDVGVLDIEKIIQDINSFYGTTSSIPYLIYKSDPITFPTPNPGKYLIDVNCNDLATAGAYGFAMTITMLLPPSVNEERVLQIQENLNEEAKRRNIIILGGHTEITSAVNSLVLSGNMIGFVPPKFYIGRNPREGSSIVFSGYCGAEGTGILLSEGREEFEKKLSKNEMNTAEKIGKEIDITSRTLETIKKFHNRILMIHDVTEGGILGAIYESLEPLGLGVNLQSDKIPVADVTNKIAEIVQIDPLRLIGSGGVIFFCKRDGVQEIVQYLNNYDFPASIIGSVTANKKLLLDGKKIDPPKSDELILGLKNLTS